MLIDTCILKDKIKNREHVKKGMQFHNRNLNELGLYIYGKYKNFTTFFN